MAPKAQIRCIENVHCRLASAVSSPIPLRSRRISHAYLELDSGHAYVHVCNTVYVLCPRCKCGTSGKGCLRLLPRFSHVSVMLPHARAIGRFAFTSTCDIPTQEFPQMSLFLRVESIRDVGHVFATTAVLALVSLGACLFQDVYNSVGLSRTLIYSQARTSLASNPRSLVALLHSSPSRKIFVDRTFRTSLVSLLRSDG